MRIPCAAQNCSKSAASILWTSDFPAVRAGARNGGSLMIGGEREMFQRLEPLFRDLSVPGGYSYFGAAGAGHFVKMVHNGIEYGMMQSLAEGFAIMKKSPFKLDLEQVAEVYNRGSVIESNLVGWLEEAYKMYGQDLKTVSGSVAYTGEGEWTVKTGKKLKVPVHVIEDSSSSASSQKNRRAISGRCCPRCGTDLAGMR